MFGVEDRKLELEGAERVKLKGHRGLDSHDRHEGTSLVEFAEAALLTMRIGHRANAEGNLARAVVEALVGAATCVGFRG